MAEPPCGMADGGVHLYYTNLGWDGMIRIVCGDYARRAEWDKAAGLLCVAGVAIHPETVSELGGVVLCSDRDDLRLLACAGYDVRLIPSLC